MSTEPMMVLMRANVRAGEIRREQPGTHGTPPNPGVLIGAPTHSGAFLLQALEEMGWELRPKASDDDWSDLNRLAHRAVVAAQDMDEIHKALSVPLMLAALESIFAAGLVVSEGEDR